MARRSNKVCVPFQPLLEKIVAWLQFPPPAYGFIDATKNNAFVRVGRPNTRSRFLFYGGDASSAEESRERAAHKAVKRLIARFNVRVDDFTHERLKMYRLCVNLYKNRCAELVQEREALNRIRSECISGENATFHDIHVSVDFVRFLCVLVRKTGVTATAIETTMVQGHGYISWLMVTCPHTVIAMECIFSDPCAEAAIAEQRVAKKASFFITSQFHLEIVDANYGTASKLSAECSLMREKYLILKGHVECLERGSKQSDPGTASKLSAEFSLMREKYLILKGHVECLERGSKQSDPANCVGVDCCVTPTAEESQIPVLALPPSLPLKRRIVVEESSKNAMEVETSERLVTGLLDLETGNLEAFTVEQKMLSTKPFFVQVTPTQELAMNIVLLWTLKTIDVGDDEPSTQIPASIVPMTCTTNTEQHYASSYAATANAHGKAAIVSKSDFNADFNANSAASFDEAFAEAMQFQEIRMASQAFDTDCLDIPNQSPSKGIVISESPEPAAELPTWAKLSRPRSNAKNRKTLNEDVDMDTEDEDHVPRKKLRTALFKDNAGKDTAENKDSATCNLNDA